MNYPDLIKQTSLTVKNGVVFLSDPGRFDHFQELYLALRMKENRLFSDEQVASLPYLDPLNPLHDEWLLRAGTLKKFKSYINVHQPGGPVLDLGCGNGWFTRNLKEITRQTVIGLDVNSAELEQASRVFTNEGLLFVFGNIFEDLFYPAKFHLIVLNSSIQYFQDLEAILERLSALLHPKGEIHILDSPVYRGETEARLAKERTLVYYRKLGFPGMTENYFHHNLQEFNSLKTLTAELLYDPKSLKNQLKKALKGSSSSPFVWIRLIKK